MTVAHKVTIVTGAAGSLGRALVERFAEAGAAAIVLADVDTTALDGVVERVRAAGAQADCRTVDVSDLAAVEGLVDETVARFGRLDVMINNAGVLAPNGRIHNLGDDDWERSIAVNLLGTVHGIRAAVRVMRPQGGGAIVNTGSVAGLTAWAYAAPYGATKAAVIHLTRIAALEYARDRIRVNCVCPGTFPSAIHAGLPDGALDAIAARHPLGLGSAHDLAGAFLYLAGDDAAWTTGAVLTVDGGYSLP
jgi:NAD(P)-dependent dehydrogenase (short-subunit alcohol dehydrogenase family)